MAYNYNKVSGDDAMDAFRKEGMSQNKKAQDDWDSQHKDDGAEGRPGDWNDPYVMNYGRYKDAYWGQEGPQKKLQDKMSELQAQRDEENRRTKEEELNQRRSVLMGQAADQGRTQLAQNLAGVKKQSAQRGLLYSGLKQAGDASARNQMASSLAGYQQKLNASTENDLNSWNNQQAQQGLVNYQNAADAAAQQYQQALGNKQQSSSSIGSIMGGLGSIAGAAGGMGLLGKK